MTAPIKQISFAGGEVAPALYGRTDHIKYETGLRTMRNMMAMRHGGATQRPGTMYVGTAQNGGAAVRLIPFIFNETGNGQSYVLEFGNQYVGFYQNGGVVVSGGNPYTIASPYLQADLATLDFAESADVVTITHPNYAPYELKRISALNWTLTQITFGSQQAAPTGVSAAGTAGANASFGYHVTAVSATGEESLAGAAVCANTLAPSGANPVTVQWSAPAGAVSYRVYRSIGVNSPFGFIGTTAALSFVDNGVTPDFTNQDPISNAVFSGANNYPATVGYVQQRRAFAQTNNNPIGFWLSQPGNYYNFNTRLVPQASDAVISSVAGDEVNAIKHLLELKFMLLLTAGAEIYVQGNGNGVVTPSSINASVQTQYGSSALKPLKVGDVCIFNQALGAFIRDFAFDFAIGGYHGNDITVFSSHLFEGSSLVDWCYQKIPDSIVWAVRNDGVLLGLTYVREQQILAWHHHDFQNGTVENVCAIPENGQYSVYLSIKRVINGATVRYIERMSSRIWSDDLNATYLDCFSSFNGVNQAATTMALTVPGGGTFVTDNTAYQQQLTLTASAGFFTPAMVGNQIFLSDAAFASVQGNQVDPENPITSIALSKKGNQVRCTIQAYIDTQNVTVTPNKAVPASLQSVALTTWARAVKTVSGLGYLAGQQVSVWADRFVVGSPLNTRVKTIYTVGSDGTLTLDKWYSVIYVGLPMTADLQTLDIETYFGETLIGRRKRQLKLGLYLYNTRTLFAGSENPDSNPDNTANDALFQLYELKGGLSKVKYDQPPELMTDQDWLLEETRWNKNGRIFVRNVDPVPLTILAVVPGGDSPVDQAFGKRV